MRDASPTLVRIKDCRAAGLAGLQGRQNQTPQKRRFFPWPNLRPMAESRRLWAFQGPPVSRRAEPKTLTGRSHKIYETLENVPTEYEAVLWLLEAGNAFEVALQQGLRV